MKKEMVKGKINNINEINELLVKFAGSFLLVSLVPGRKPPLL